MVNTMFNGSVFQNASALPDFLFSSPAMMLVELLAQDDGGKNYVFPYFVVGLVTLIGLAVACRPAKREDRVPDKFDV